MTAKKKTPRSRVSARTRKVASPRRRSSSSAGRPQSLPLEGGLAPGMQSVNTFLAVANVGATMDFLERVFGFSRGVWLPDTDGQLRYAEMRHGNSVVMLIRKGDEMTPTGGVPALYTYVQDVDRALTDAREAGAAVGEAGDQPWGDRVAVVTDPDGYRWVLATFRKLAPFSA